MERTISNPCTRRRPGLLVFLHRIAALHRQRRMLRDLSARQLDDIGINESEAVKEAERPIWDVPRNWRR